VLIAAVVGWIVPLARSFDSINAVESMADCIEDRALLTRL
jgi:hypothetical protein